MMHPKMGLAEGMREIVDGLQNRSGFASHSYLSVYAFHKCAVDESKIKNQTREQCEISLAVGAVRATASQVPLALRRAGGVPVRIGHRIACGGLAVARRRHHSL